MLLRIVLFLGVALFLAAGGTAGWQYWHSLPQAVAEAPEAGSAAPKLLSAPPARAEDTGSKAEQSWLISAGGGLVPRDQARNFLAQHRFDENRWVLFRFRAPLAALLAEGEALPDPVYHLAFAEIRSKAVAARLCEPLLQAWAQGCAVHATDLVDDTYDPATVTAEFEVQIVFSLKPDPLPLPDLAARSFRTEGLGFDQDLAAGFAATPEAFLAYGVDLGDRACAVWKASGEPCRVMRMLLHWQSPFKASGRVEVGALGPLPKGVYAAPPLY
jgi:hypothetical protein